MIKIILSILLSMLTVNAWASAPSRPNTYTSGTTILASAVTANEVTLYSYLQAGVDTYKAGSITNAAISSTAGILYSQLNLSGGILPTDFNTSTTSNIYTLENLNIPSGGTFTLGTTHQGDILYDNGASFIRLPSSSASTGEVLTSGGLNANPQWATPSLYNFNTQNFNTVGSFSFFGLSPNTKYKLIVNYVQITTPGQPSITFNGDSGLNYVSSNGSWQNNSFGTYASGNAAFFYLTPNVNVDVNTYYQGEILFQTGAGSNTKVILNANDTFTDAGNMTTNTLGGVYSGASNLTSITFTTIGGFMTGSATLYQMN